MAGSTRIGALVVLLAGALGALWWVREPAPVALTPAAAGAVVFDDVEYGPHARNVFDVYVPDAPGPHPAIIWLHPGGWVHGDKAASMPVWDWTERGYAVVAVNHRYATPPATVHDSVDDALTALRTILRDHEVWDLDRDRIGIFGFSAGGHLAAMLHQAGEEAVDLRVAAVAIAGAPTDLVPLLDPAVPFFDGNRGPDVVDAVRSLLGCTPTSVDCEERARVVSPARLAPGPTDLLVVHGADDHIVDVDQARRFGTHLEAAGAAAELVIVRPGGHSPLVDEGGIAAFFDERLLS